MRIEFRAPNLVRGFGPLVGSSFLFGACRVNTMSLKKKLPVGLAVCLCAALYLRVVLAPPAFAFSSRQRLHWTGLVSCWHHYHLNTADVVSVRAHSVSAVCACAIVFMCTKDNCHAHDEHKDGPLCPFACLSTHCPRSHTCACGCIGQVHQLL